MPSFKYKPPSYPQGYLVSKKTCSNLIKNAAVLKKFLSSLPEVFQTSLETLSTIQTLKMTSVVILDDWTCDWHSQASGIAFQTFVQMYWCSLKHLCSPPSFLEGLGGLEDTYWKTPRTSKAEENFYNYSKLRFHIMGQRAKEEHETFLSELSGKTERPAQLLQDLLMPTRVENW